MGAVIEGQILDVMWSQKKLDLSQNLQDNLVFLKL
jgi:octaprenyl-diphosphate synthase